MKEKIVRVFVLLGFILGELVVEIQFRITISLFFSFSVYLRCEPAGVIECECVRAYICLFHRNVFCFFWGETRREIFTTFLDSRTHFVCTVRDNERRNLRTLELWLL